MIVRVYLYIAKLIGDDDTVVKKAQFAIDAWQKAARKAELIKSESGKKENNAKWGTTFLPPWGTCSRCRRGANTWCFICKSFDIFLGEIVHSILSSRLPHLRRSHPPNRGIIFEPVILGVLNSLLSGDTDASWFSTLGQQGG
jgi:hypothetical protein